MEGIYKYFKLLLTTRPWITAKPQLKAHIGSNNSQPTHVPSAAANFTSPAPIKLKAKGIKTYLLSGDSEAKSKAIAGELGIDEVHSDLLPADKVEQMERLFSEKSKKGKLVFVGDGINDAPVLARADIGIAMGALGSDAAIEAADIVIMNDKPSRIATVMGISRKTLNIVIQNISLAFIVKFAALVLGAFGMATLWEAVFADVGVAVLAILNAIRALRYKEK